MSFVVNTVNTLLTALFDLLLWPFAWLSPEWGLVALSLLSGIGLLVLYGKVSNQSAIRAVKRRISASLLEAILFRHDLRLSLSAQGKMLRGGAIYFFLAVPPIVILSAPCLLVLAQLNLRYGVRGLLASEQAIVEAKVADPEKLFEIKLIPSEGLESTPPLRAKEESAVYWRVSAGKGGKIDPTLLLSDGKREVRKELFFGEMARAIPALSTKSPWWGLLYPGELMLDPRSSPVSEISVSYPERNLSLFGMGMHWIVVFFALSLVSGIAASKILEIEI